MRKYAVALVCLVIGCAAGSAVPRLAAQDIPSLNAQAPRGIVTWEQVCEMKGGLGTGDARARAVESINRTLASRGRQGWELVDAPVITTGHSSNAWSELMLCFKRPVAQ